MVAIGLRLNRHRVRKHRGEHPSRPRSALPDEELDRYEHGIELDREDLERRRNRMQRRRMKHNYM